MVLGPADRIGMLERPVLRIDAIGIEADVETARRQVTLRPDIVAVEEVDGRGAGAGYLADAEPAVGIIRRGAGPFDVRARDLQAARDAVPQEWRNSPKATGAGSPRQEILARRRRPLQAKGDVLW